MNERTNGRTDGDDEMRVVVVVVVVDTGSKILLFLNLRWSVVLSFIHSFIDNIYNKKKRYMDEYLSIWYIRYRESK
mgnify:CR=1 FL=1